MKRTRKILTALFALSALGTASAPAHADNGIIRIGDNCYIDIGFYLPVPCPREVSGE